MVLRLKRRALKRVAPRSAAPFLDDSAEAAPRSARASANGASSAAATAQLEVYASGDSFLGQLHSLGDAEEGLGERSSRPSAAQNLRLLLSGHSNSVNPMPAAESP